jgi:hypothetical protein
VTFSVSKSNSRSSDGFSKVVGDVVTDERTARLYLRDLGQLVKEMALDAKLERDGSVGGDDEDLRLGRLMALHEVVGLMRDQALAFGIEPSDLSLDDIDPDLDLT